MANPQESDYKLPMNLIGRIFGSKFYWRLLPPILALLGLSIFLISGIILMPWTNGWLSVAVLFLLSFETLFLPYLVLPLAICLPALLPWVNYSSEIEAGIVGTDRLPQRILLGATIIMSGLPVMASYEAASNFSGPFYLTIPFAFIHGARFPIFVFLLLTVVLALPDLGQENETLT